MHTADDIREPEPVWLCIHVGGHGVHVSRTVGGNRVVAVLLLVAVVDEVCGWCLAETDSTACHN